MATSGKIQGTTYDSSGANKSANYGTWIEWKRNSYSIPNNTSNITVTVYVQRIDSWDGDSAHDLTQKPSVSFKVGGVAKTPTIYYIDTRDHKLCTVATWTGDVSHTANGSLSLALSCSYTTQLSYLKSGSISGTAVLDTIPRASTFGTVSGTTIGSTMTVNITRAVSTFTHQLWYKVGNSAWYDLGKNIGTSKAFTIDIATANQFPNATSGNLQLCLRTFNGTSQIGSDVYKDVTVSVPSYSPTISNIALTGNNLLSGAYVQGKSTVTAEITASTMYGATIKSYSATVDGKTYTGNKFTSSALSNGSKTVSVTVTDTRGKTATLSSSAFTVYAYAVPSITEFTVERQADGTTVIATVKGTVSAINNKNAKTITVTLNGKTQTITSSSYTINGTTTFTNVPTDNTFTATAKITDSYITVPKDAVLPTVEVTMDFHNSGKGVAFGKVAETEGLLDVAWAISSGKPEQTMSNLTYKGQNPITKASEDTLDFWAKQGNLSTCFFNDKTVDLNKPSTWGYVLNISSTPGTPEFHQLWLEQANGSIYHRGANASAINQWRKVLDAVNCPDYVIERGTSNGWEYTKWNSGKMELFGEKSLSFPAGSKQTDYLYRSIVSLDLSSLLTKIMSGTCSIQTNGMVPQVCRHSTNLATAEIVIVTSRTFSEFTITAPIYIIGKWK